MKRLLFLMAILVGGAIAVQRLVTPERREALSHLPETMRGQMMERMVQMCQMIEQMPDDFPPKVMMSNLRRLQEQNEQLLALMQEQNDLLRERLPVSESSSPQRRPSRASRSADE